MKLIFAMLINLVSLQQSHRKNVGMSSDGHCNERGFTSLVKMSFAHPPVVALIH